MTAKTDLRFKVDRLDILFVSLIILSALFLRLFYLFDYQKTSVFPLLSCSDGYYYFLWGKDIAAGDLLGNRVFMKWPLYAYFLGFIFKLFGSNVSVTYSLQFVLGSLNCALVYLIAKILFNRPVALISALLCVFYGLFMFYDGLLIYTTLSLFCNSLLFLYILLIREKLDKKKMFLLGLLLGICALIQGNIIIFGVFAAIVIIQQNKSGIKKAVTFLSLFLLGATLVIGSATLRNYLLEKDFVLVSGNLGVNFFLGNSSGATGKFYCPQFTPNQEAMFRDAKIIARIDSKRDLKPSEISAFWFNRSFVFIKKDPVSFLKLTAKKIILLFSPKEEVHDPEYLYIREEGIRAFNVTFKGLQIILPFCLLGAVLNLKKLKQTVLLYIILAALSLSIVMFFVATRYRIALVPFMAIFAGSAIFEIWQSFKSKRYAFFVLLLASSLALWLLSNHDLFKKTKYPEENNKFSEYNYHFYKAIQLGEHKDFRNAIREFQQAFALKPNSHYVIFSIGALYYAMGDFKQAEEKFQEAIHIFPYYVDAYYNLGYLYNRQNRHSEALAVLRKAEDYDFQDPGVHFELGKAYKALKQPVKARDEFGIALQKINPWRKTEIKAIQAELSDADR